jgi:hypothetical protein
MLGLGVMIHRWVFYVYSIVKVPSKSAPVAAYVQLPRRSEYITSYSCVENRLRKLFYSSSPSLNFSTW